MYIPKMNEEKRIPVMHDLMRVHSFACLVALGANGLMASHIPMVLEQDGSEFGILKGHLSRANSQWRDLTPGVEALAIFSGAHHYISPSWYPTKQESGKVVPTWNYVVVHAYGTLKTVEDPSWLLSHLESLTNKHEASFKPPWKVADAPPEYIRQMSNGIIGLELPISRLEGKWKLSQNKNASDLEGVVNGLNELGTSESLAMKALVEQIETSKPEST
jgi:transcriptional regulator